MSPSLVRSKLFHFYPILSTHRSDQSQLPKRYALTEADRSSRAWTGARRILFDQSRVDLLGLQTPSIPPIGRVAGHLVPLSTIDILLDDSQ